MSKKNVGGVSSAQTTLTFPVESTAICGCGPTAEPRMLERFMGVEKVTPPSLERVKKTNDLPPTTPSHTTLMLPLESRATCGGDVRAGAVERALGVEKVAPPSVERLKKMSPRGGVPWTTLSIQTTFMLPAG